MAQKRFDKVVGRLVVGTIIAFTIAVFCLIATICAIFKCVNFINEFEYVEETEIQIEQDWHGDNRVTLNDGTEVEPHGAEVHGNEEEVLEKENNKNNTINVYR
jgi:hypothetical protein